MRFWTALQEPLNQAALIENGKIIKVIPENPSGTPARKVLCVSKYNDNLVIGRRNSIEIWDFEGEKMLNSIYSPLIYGLHEINQYKEDLIVCCTILDVIFRIDLNGNIKWKWFAHEHNFCPNPNLLDDPNWQTTQLTKSISPPNSSHLNSCRVHGNKVLIALMKNKKALEIKIGEQEYKVILANSKDGLHSPVIIENNLCYATIDNLILGNTVISYDYGKKEGYLWVKRIVQHEDKIFFSHENGISYLHNNKIVDINLPRPFGIVF